MNRVVVLLLFGVGCGPAVSGQGSGDASSGMPDVASSSGGSTSSGSSGAAASSSSSSGAESSSTGDVLEGLGCGVTPTCTEQIVEGNVGVSSLEDLEALAGVADIAGDLQIASSDLVCLDALACLRRVAGEIRILENPDLRSTAGLSGVEDLGYDAALGSGGRGLVVAENASLEALEGFDGLVSVQHGLLVWDNPSLQRISGLTSIRGTPLLSITNNPALESLEGLHGLVELYDCNVNRNPSLCISEVFEVCGDIDPAPEGVTNGNDDGC